MALNSHRYRERLIDEVKKCPVLYDTKHEHHRDIDVRDRCWLEISERLGANSKCKRLSTLYSCDSVCFGKNLGIDVGIVDVLFRAFLPYRAATVKEFVRGSMYTAMYTYLPISAAKQ